MQRMVRFQRSWRKHGSWKKLVSSEPTHFDSRAGRIGSSPIERTCPGGGERDARFGRQECRRKLGERSELWRGPTDKNVPAEQCLI